MHRFWLHLIPLWMISGCTSPFDPAAYVTGLRVLGVKAEPPEIAPGETSSLSALVVDTDGAAVSYSWASCLDPPGPNDPGINPDCVTQDSAPFLTPLGGAATTTVTMPNVTAEQLGLPDYTLGVYLPVRLTVDASGGAVDGRGLAEVRSIYRVRFATGLAPRNQNPKLSGLYVVAGPGYPDGGVTSITPLDDAHPLPAPLTLGDKITLRALIDIDSLETYPQVGGDPNDPSLVMAIEQPRFQWYATAGSFDTTATRVDRPDTVFTLDTHVPGAPDGGGPATVTIWVVAHDERGGTDWLSRTIPIR